MSIQNIKDRLAGKKPEILPRYQSKGFGVKFYELKEVAEANPENRSAKALGAFYAKEKHRIAPNTVVYPDRTLLEAALEGVEVEVVETSDDEGTGTVKKLEKKKKRETKTS